MNLWLSSFVDMDPACPLRPLSLQFLVEDKTPGLCAETSSISLISFAFLMNH